MSAILGLLAIFLIWGIIKPSRWHHQVKLSKRVYNVVALIVLGIVGNALGLGGDQTSTAQPQQTPKATNEAKVEATAPAPAPKPTPKPVPKPKQWTKVIELSGDQSNSPSDRFQLTGGDVKMVWEITPDNEIAKDMVMMGGFLEDAGTNTNVDEFMANMGQKSGEWKVYGVPAGTYYFKPNTANGHWKATIYEMK